MAKSSSVRATDPIGDALHAVTTGSQPTEKPSTPTQNIPDAPPAGAPAAVTGTVAAAADQPRPVYQLSPQRLVLQGYLHNAWDITVPHGITLEDVKRVECFVHVGNTFKPLDRARILCEDGTWEADVTIVACDKMWARLYIRHYHDLTKSYENMPHTQEEEYEITWTVTGKYGVRKKNLPGQPPMKDGFNTKLDAYTWLDGYLKTINK